MRAVGQLRFMVICCVPVATIGGLVVGGPWNWLGFLVFIAVYLSGDVIFRRSLAAPLPRGSWFLDALLFAQVPLVVLAWLAFLVSFSGTGGILPAIGEGLEIGSLARDATAAPGELLGAGLSFAVTIAIAGVVTAHELVHRINSTASLVSGRVLLAFIFDAAFSIEHVYGHHKNAATWTDPATARRGESLYRYTVRFTIESFRGAWAIERKRLARRGRKQWSWSNRNLRGIAISLALVAATAVIGGTVATVAFIACAVYGKLLLAATNYVEHYGLVRVPGTPVAARHSWDTSAAMSGIGMFNLGRHAAHHVAVRPYWALPLEAASPKLPGGLLISVFMAAIPPLWNRKMVRRLARWDRDQASEAERDLGLAAERAAGLGWARRLAKA